jgi:23S rRNA (uracil1939-C5)-methyltransferase
VQAPCPYFGQCGGCQYQHSSYEHQLGIKAAILKENLRRLAKLELSTELLVHPSPPWNYRNRSRLQVRWQPEFAVGYHTLGSHALEAIHECPISSQLINTGIRALWEIAPFHKLETIREVAFFANAEDDQLLVELYIEASAGKAWSDKEPARATASGTDPSAERAFVNALRAAVPQVAGVAVLVSPLENSTQDRESKLVDSTGERSLVYGTQRTSYRVSAGAFFQTNRFLTDELVDIVTSGRSGGLALDLYAGVGLFSSVLSREFERVIAVEASLHSASDLSYNSGANVKTVPAKVEEYLRKSTGKLRPDLVIVDPPRGGLGEKVAKTLAGLQAPRLTYVSCDPATLARDISPFVAAGYHVEQGHLVDLFPQTFHLETVLHLVR